MLKDIKLDLDIRLRLLSIVLLIYGIFYIFNFNTIILIGVTVGIILTVTFLNNVSVFKLMRSKVLISLVYSALTIYAIYYSAYTFITAILLGTNIYAALITFHNESFKLQKNKASSKPSIVYTESIIPLVNVILFTAIGFGAKIYDYRGSNMLQPFNIILTITLIILIIVAYKFLAHLLKSAKRINFEGNLILYVLITTLYFFCTFFALSYFFYKEINMVTIFLPLFLGVTVFLVDKIKSVNNKIIATIFSSYVIFALGFSYASYLGVILAIFTAVALASMLNKQSENKQSLIFKLYPAIMIAVTAVVQDKAGLIPNINLFEMQTLFEISTAILIIAVIYTLSKAIYKLLVNNESERIYSFIKLIIMTILIYFLVKYSFKSIGIMILYSSVFIYLYEFTKSKTYKELKSYEYTLDIVTLLGTLSILATITV